MDDSLPLSINLSPAVREILGLIIQDQESIQGPTEPERTILLWANGASETETAKDLGISVETVRLLRMNWWLSTARIKTAEKKSHKAFNDLVALIFRIPNQDISTTEPQTSVSDLKANGISQRLETSTSQTQLCSTTRALIEILHHKPKVYGINRSNWNQESLAEAFGKLYGQRPSKSWVGRQLRKAGLTWKKSRRVLTSPDPNYREKVEVLLNTLRSLTADEDLFFVDELGPLQVKRYGGRSYTAKGTTLTHPQSQKSKGSTAVRLN